MEGAEQALNQGANASVMIIRPPVMVVPLGDHVNRVALVIAYYGRWPVWMPAFLRSCAENPEIDWLIITDLKPPRSPRNVYYHEYSMLDLEEAFSAAVGQRIRLQQAYKLVDLKPVYGLAFASLLNGYEFWGICDLDIVWGNIKKFVTDATLDTFDVVSTRRERIAGHFSLFRNDDRTRELFRRHPLHKKCFSDQAVWIFDETGMTETIRNAEAGKELRVHWPTFLVNYPPQSDLVTPSLLPFHSGNWYWNNGSLFVLTGQHQGEAMYIHFMTWKSTLQYCSFDYDDHPEEFWISWSHIHHEADLRPSISHLAASWRARVSYKSKPTLNQVITRVRNAAKNA